MKQKLIKILIPAAVIIAAVIIIIAAASAQTDKPIPLSKAELPEGAQVTLISHRGMSISAPENTIEAALKSAEAGYTHIEFDIRRTLDGVWVLMHDEDIKRTTNGKGEISLLTYKQILRHSIDSKDGYVAVPTLKMMLNTCANNKLTPVIEIKQSGTEYIKEMLNVVADNWNSECMFITFDREQAELIYSLLEDGVTTLYKSDVTVMWLTSELDKQTLETAKSNTDIGVSFNGNKAGTEKEIKAFTDAGISLAAWTVNKPKRLKELNSLGITTFTTDTIVYNEITDGED